MSENDTAKKTEAKKRPSHFAYQVRESDNGKSHFNRVGSAFAHKDGQGFNLILESVPVDGRITLRTPQERIQAMNDGKADGHASKGHER